MNCVTAARIDRPPGDAAVLLGWTDETVLPVAPKAPVVTELAESVEVGLAHVAVEDQLAHDGVEVNPVFQFRREFQTVWEPVQIDEVIHGNLQRLRSLIILTV